MMGLVAAVLAREGVGNGGISGWKRIEEDFGKF
jgi:hypothetical protein